MKRPPLWILKRELNRFFRRLLDFNSMATYFFGALYYDLFKARHAKHYPGQSASKNKVAIYVIYPALGLMSSHLRAINYIASKGYAPLVVSNLPLKQSEIKAVTQICWHYIERPNFGYDFGGYREGMLHIKRELKDLDAVVLLNDSCWFPVIDSADWLGQAEALGVDFAGAASSNGLSRKPLADFRHAQIKYSPHFKNFHYCSYALRLGSKILRNPDFIKFWQSFPLTNRKDRTVRRGEVGLSRWVISRKYTHGETLHIADLENKLRKLNAASIKDIFDNIIILDNSALRSTKSALVAQLPVSPEERTDAYIAFILAATARQGISYALAHFNIIYGDLPFLKKSPVWLDEDCYQLTLNLIQHLDPVIGDEIRQEIALLRKNRRT